VPGPSAPLWDLQLLTELSPQAKIDDDIFSTVIAPPYSLLKISAGDDFDYGTLIAAFWVTRCISLLYFGRWTDKAPFRRVFTFAILTGAAGGLMWAAAPLVVGPACAAGWTCA
jgi:MFS family permease